MDFVNSASELGRNRYMVSIIEPYGRRVPNIWFELGLQRALPGQWRSIRIWSIIGPQSPEHYPGPDTFI